MRKTEFALYAFQVQLPAAFPKDRHSRRRAAEHRAEQFAEKYSRCQKFRAMRKGSYLRGTLTFIIGQDGDAIGGHGLACGLDQIHRDVCGGM